MNKLINASQFNSRVIKNFRITCTHNCGFTLVEILVALAIIAIALAALIKTSGDHTYSATYLKQKTLAHYVAMNELAKLQVEKKWPAPGEVKKSTEMADYEWYWTRDIEKVINPLTGQPTNDFIEVSFTVFLDEDRKKNLTTLTSYLARIDSAEPLPGQ